MSIYFEEPIADDYGFEDEYKDDPKDEPSDDSTDFKDNLKTTTDVIDAANKGATLITTLMSADNDKAKKEALDALVNEVPKLEAKIDEQTKLVERLKLQSVELLGAIEHNYEVITEIQGVVNYQSNVIDNKFITIENKLNVVLMRIEQAKQAITQHIEMVEADIIQNHINEPKLKVINNLSNIFDAIIMAANEFKQLSIEQKVDSFDNEANVLKEWEQTRIPQFEDGVFNSLWDIINEDWAIPSDRDDHVSFITLGVLCYGMYFYAYILHYLMEQYSQLLEYYRLNTDTDKYNRCYYKKLNTLNDFASTLIGSNGFFGKVEEVLTRVKYIDFIQFYRKDVQLFADANIENLALYKRLLRRLHGSFMNTAPRMLEPGLDFSTSNTSTIDSYHVSEIWIKGAKVSYAIQLLSQNMTTSSLVSKWSPGYTLEDKANPIVKVYPDPLNRTRVIFRRIDGNFRNSNKPKIVAILQDPKQSEFRDIDRDLYDFASLPDPEISLPKVKFYLEHGANANAILERHQVALHAAAQNRDHWLVASELIKNGADIDVQDVEGYTPLSIATENGHDEFVAKLIEQKANVTLTTSEKHHQLTPLHIAAYNGYNSIVQELLKAKDIDVNARSIEGFTALHFATAYEFEDIVSLLLEDKRTEIDPKTYFRVAVPGHQRLIKNLDRIASILATSAKVTPLHMAYAVGNEKVVSLLLAKGADINARTSDGSSVMHFAAFYDNVDLIPDCSNNSIFSSPNEYYITPLYTALQHNNKAVAAKFLNQCADIEVLLYKSGTMLHMAVLAGDSNVVEQLIDKDLWRFRDEKGNSGMQYAIAMGNSTMVEQLLLKYPYYYDDNDINMEPYVHSIFRTASQANAFVMLELFTKGMRDINILDRSSNSLLHYASALGYDSVVDLLLKQPKIKVDPVNERNETPLHLALKLGYVKIANSLFDHGASVTQKGRDDWTAVNYAIGGKLDAAQTVAFVEKFLPITKECDLTDDHNHVLFDMNILQAAEHDKFEVVKFYGEHCEGLKNDLAQGHSTFAKIDTDYVAKLCERGNAKVLKYLFPLKPKNDYQTYDGRQFPVICALKGNTNFEVIQYLNDNDIKLVIDIFLNHNFPNSTNWDALRYAIMGKGNRLITEFIVDHAVLYNNIPMDLSKLHDPNDESENLMHIAARANKSEIAEYLFEKKVDVNAVNKDGYSPLHIASRNGDLKTVRFLIENGAKAHIDEESKNNTSPLAEAVWNNGDLDLVQYLIEECNAKLTINDGWTLMHKAAQLDKTYVAIYLCNKMPQNECTDRLGGSGTTALHFAASNDNINLAENLFSKGIKPNAIDALDITPIYYAIRDQGQLQMVKYLHSKGADIVSMTNVKNEDNLISLAISNGKYDIAKYLIAHGADVNTAGKSEKSPLFEAVRADNSELIRLLVQNGADYSRNPAPINEIFNYYCFNALNYFKFHFEDKKNGRTLLHERTVFSDGYDVDFLIIHGVDVNSLDNQKNTALHLVAEKGYIKVVESLMNSKCLNISIKNANDQTALALAEANNHQDIVDLLKKKPTNRKRRDIATDKSVSVQSVASSATRSVGLINQAIESFVSVLKAVPTQMSNLVSFRLNENFNAHSSVPRSAFPSVQSTDLNSTLLLLDVLIRKHTGQQYVNTTMAHSDAPLESRLNALELVEQLQEVLQRLAHQSGQKVVELDWFGVFRKVERLVFSAQYDKIESLVYSTARNAFAQYKMDNQLLQQMVNKLLMETRGQNSDAKMDNFPSISNEILPKVDQTTLTEFVDVHKQNLI